MPKAVGSIMGPAAVPKKVLDGGTMVEPQIGARIRMTFLVGRLSAIT